MLCTQCTKPVRPVVALDIDGTLGDYHTHFFRFASEYLGWYKDTEWVNNHNGKQDLASFMRISKEQYRQIKLAYRQGGMKRSMPMVDGAAMITRNLREIGCEVWLTTTRPYLRLDNVDPDTREWLSRHGIYYDHLTYDDDKYATLTMCVDPERVIMVLEDQPDQFDRAVELGLPVVMKQQRYNRGVVRSPSAPTLAAAWREAHARALEWEREHDRAHAS